MRRGIPAGILLAITLTETAMGGRPQAYAVRVGGQSHYGASEAGALDLARQPDGGLERSANIGCMQLQIASHARAFDPPEKIADPALNMRHGAALLVRAAGRERDWGRAIASHRGGDAAGRRLYLCKVWNHLRFLATASAALIDARHCGPMARPVIDLDIARLAHEMRLRLAAPPPPPPR